MKDSKLKFTTVLLAAVLHILTGAANVVGQEKTGMDSLESKVTKFTLDNGLRVIVLERHAVPVNQRTGMDSNPG